MEYIFKGIDYEILNMGNSRDFSEMEYDSRKIIDKGIFAALEGFRADGHDFIDTAVNLGAAMVIVSKNIEIKHKDVTYVRVNDLRKKLGIIASNFYNWPQNKLKIIGITGTKGKTTSTFLVETILGEDNTARIGTIEYKVGKKIVEANNTTPESLDVVKICRDAAVEKLEYLVMEVSSHALELGRVDMLTFDAVVFTNLTQDHLDYHETMENYFEAKKKIFGKLKNPENGVINIDDKWIKSLSESKGFIEISTIAGDMTGKIIETSTASMKVEISYMGSSYTFDTTLVGKFNLYNIMGAAGAAVKLGFEPQYVFDKLAAAKRVPGRIEVVDKGQDFMVVVDYAHTDASLENVLETLTEMKKKRIITVFGAGGDRDKTKRPKMAKAAAKYSDYLIVTSDNPRTEDPKKILENVEAGLTEILFPKEKYTVMEDRETAIKTSVEMAEKDDIILIAGKGHETYQIVGTVKHHFDDREIAAKYIK